MLKTLDLNGAWLVRWSDGQRGRTEYAQRETIDRARYIEAQVPGEIHLDVWKAGWIQDPYVGANCLSARWVEECIWSYRREFEAPAEALNARAWLVFEGLDLAATIALNGKEIGRHQNVFHPCRIEVTERLKSGRNVLAVHVEGGLFETANKSVDGLSVIGCDRLAKRQWMRKPQCQFSWDWSTRLINVGIVKPVRLEWTADSIRLDQMAPLATLTPDLQTGQVRVRLFVEGITGVELPGQLSVEIIETGDQTSTAVQIKSGLHPLESTVTVSRPNLWWPVGHGPQNRYTVRATLRMEGRVIGERTARIGFRHLRIDQSPHPQAGSYFIIEINGRRIFAKGGNFVPADMIFARLDRARYAALVDRALEANFNLLRIWGGGLYESDDFFDLCDEKGILVWQEFIFACARYPSTDQTFFDDFKKEALFNIRRLANHPSLIIWCGNNEMEQGAWHWSYDQGVVHPDHALFHLTIPRLLREEDPTRYYQPSSPYSPDGTDPCRDDTGDQHPWSVGFQNTDFRDYRRMICRFPNEGGILGPTALPTMLACLPEGQRFPGSFAWQIHENSVDSWGEPSFPDEMIRQWLGLDPRKMTVEEFTFWAGLVHGEGLREYCDNFRRRMFDSASAIFWMYNDCWPATRSWTIVDYYLRRTPAFHPVRRAFAPIHLVVAEEAAEIVVYGINETLQSVRGELRHGVFNLAGGYPLDRRIPVDLAPNASTRIAAFPSEQWKDRNASMAFGVLFRDEKVIARNRLFTPFFKEILWPDAEIRVHCAEGYAVFECDRFAWGVCLDLEGETPLADNFFDVYPGIPHVIPWRAAQPPVLRNLGNSLIHPHSPAARSREFDHTNGTCVASIPVNDESGFVRP